MKPYEMSHHARKVLEERQIPIDWMERTIAEPERILPDPEDAAVERRWSGVSGEFRNMEGACYGWPSTSRLIRSAL